MSALKDEFATVDLIVSSGSETRGVDAFALSLIKAERQIRKIFTHLVFQSPSFDSRHINALRNALVDRRVYFDGFIRGIDALYFRSVADLVGREYQELRARLDEATHHRNKIFHGQLTAVGLSRQQLLALTADIRSWCEALAIGADAEIGYDGFHRGSFTKSERSDLDKRCRVLLSSATEYRKFITKHMERK